MFGGISKVFSICKYPFYHRDVWGISKIFIICKYPLYDLKSRKQRIAPDDPVSYYFLSFIVFDRLFSEKTRLNLNSLW